jgi:hypothetical protein
VLVILMALPVLVSRLETYRAAKARFAEIEREFPSLVAVLESRR